MSSKMPVVFFGHGNPMNAISSNAYTEAWRQIGMSVPRPRAILSISAHWYIPKTAVTSMPQPRTIHDFGGFPPELYTVKYDAPGSPELAERVAHLIGSDVVLDDQRWGFDHGTWSVLVHVFPNADIPIVQLSLNESEPAEVHYEKAKRLAPLRDEGVLIIGSGNLVHNLHTYAWGRHDVVPFEWVTRFEAGARALILAHDHQPLIAYEKLGRDALLAVPTPEHYLPLLYILALQSEGEPVSFPVEGFDGGSISMTAVQVG